MKEIKNSRKGFTLLELLVVVLIIGILAAIALPQYKMAVTKAKVGSILPVLRRWNDALEEWKLVHGNYCKRPQDLKENGSCWHYPDATELDASWPSNFKKYGTEEPCGNANSCYSDYWTSCHVVPSTEGVFCSRSFSSGRLDLMIFPSDFGNENMRGKIMCRAWGLGNQKICRRLGGEEVLKDGNAIWYHLR